MKNTNEQQNAEYIILFISNLQKEMTRTDTYDASKDKHKHISCNVSKLSKNPILESSGSQPGVRVPLGIVA